MHWLLNLINLNYDSFRIYLKPPRVIYVFLLKFIRSRRSESAQDVLSNFGRFYINLQHLKCTN